MPTLRRHTEVADVLSETGPRKVADWTQTVADKAFAFADLADFTQTVAEFFLRVSASSQRFSAPAQMCWILRNPAYCQRMSAVPPPAGHGRRVFALL